MWILLALVVMCIIRYLAEMSMWERIRNQAKLERDDEDTDD